MTANDVLKRMTNGAAHVVLIDNDTGEVILKTIWYNAIPKEHLSRDVCHINVTDYTITLMVE